MNVNLTSKKKKKLGEFDEFSLAVGMLGHAECEIVCIDIVLQHKKDLSILAF